VPPRVIQVAVPEPFRLDLTANVLRRLSTNVVDRYHEGHFQRLLGTAEGPTQLDVTQAAPDRLDVHIDGAFGGDIEALVRRMLGVDVDLAPFYAASAATPWLADLVARARGVKPPRYPSLWEAIVNAVVFQQISIHAASAILRRVIESLTPARSPDGLSLFPEPDVFANADPAALRARGLSLNKVVALQRLARRLLEGAIDPATLEGQSTPALLESLVAHPGIGPWTAALIAIRGFGRLDVFPLRDSGVARGLRDLTGEADVDVNALLATLGTYRGMLYYHLLLARLDARGEVLL
jgi:DNA-3-methyladenine glycosylase II